MDYLERKNRSRKKQKIFDVIFVLEVLATITSAGLLIFGFLKKEILDINLLFFTTFFLAFIMCILLIIRSKMKYDYTRMVWLGIEAIVLLVLSILTFLIWV